MAARPDLQGVPETMLWPLWNRACEARRSRGLIHDPAAIELVEALDYPFARHFGRPSVLHAVRARFFDDLIRAHLQRYPQAAIVAIGEGLETQRLRLDDAQPKAWVSVDLPEAMAVRERLLPAAAGEIRLACSALSPQWWDAVPASEPPLLLAAGVLMYLDRAEVQALLAALARRFPGAAIAFDCIPRALSAKTLRGWQVTPHYRAPPMPWGEDAHQLPHFLASLPGVRLVACTSFLGAYPARAPLLAWLDRIAWLRNRYSPSLVVVAVERLRRDFSAG